MHSLLTSCRDAPRPEASPDLNKVSPPQAAKPIGALVSASLMWKLTADLCFCKNTSAAKGTHALLLTGGDVIIAANPKRILSVTNKRSQECELILLRNDRGESQGCLCWGTNGDFCFPLVSLPACWKFLKWRIWPQASKQTSIHIF